MVVLQSVFEWVPFSHPHQLSVFTFHWNWWFWQPHTVAFLYNSFQFSFNSLVYTSSKQEWQGSQKNRKCVTNLILYNWYISFSLDTSMYIRFKRNIFFAIENMKKSTLKSCTANIYSGKWDTRKKCKSYKYLP